MEWPFVIFLVGLPGSGKSTFVDKNFKDMPVVSSDNLIDEYAASQGKTYSEVFHEYIKTADAQAFEHFKELIAAQKSLIIDRTNMTVKARHKYISLVPHFYKKIAIVFQVPDNVLNDRLKIRAEATGKNIPDIVVHRLKQSFQKPSKDEGFDFINFA